MKTIALIGLLIFSSGIAETCDCIRTGNAEEEFNKAAAVFSGRLVGYTDKGTGRFRREKVWKGKKSPSVLVSTSRGTDCEAEFKKGQTYLIYTSEGVMGMHIVSQCSRIIPIEKADDDIRYLDSVTKRPSKFLP